jgi:ribonucleoside-diphosphate reductase alpha chain
MPKSVQAPKPGVKVHPLLAKNIPAFDTVKWVRKDAVIVGADGVERFRQDGVEVPDWWNDVTVNVVAEKYFRIVKMGGEAYSLSQKEFSAKQMFSRVAKWLRDQGLARGVFANEDDAAVFENEMLYLFVHGMLAFNSPVWFNVGTVENPQCSACFIQSIKDTMEDITALISKEMKLFKGGSGTGTNMSPLRSSYEHLSRGGVASGPVSFMRPLDSGAGATKSGGTTRRAAKMVLLNIDHPDIYEQANGEPGFISCKADAEKVAQDLYSTGKYTAEWNKPGNVYERVGFQNANNSVRVPDVFMNAVERKGTWYTKEVKTGKTVKTYEAELLWNSIAEAAHLCGDPGLQFDTTINTWHTCPNSGRINASNPCAEYLFIDDSACNLASLNVLRFADGKNFKIEEFVHAAELAILSMDIIVDSSSYPSEVLKENSHKFRTLGLGYANLGALLTFWGLPYDSNEGRSVAGVITSLMTAAAYRMSVHLAQVLGPFSEYEKNKDAMRIVVGKHSQAARHPLAALPKNWDPVYERSIKIWETAYEGGKIYGYRNAQVTVLAPTGTTSFLMGCDTTGIEPMAGCVIYKKVVGEGLLVMPNHVVEPSLLNLGYSQDQISRILEHLKNQRPIHTASDFDTKKHGPIFAEALGEYAIKPEAHVDMMEAVQPFISGGISKTVNMSKSATPKDISDIYMRAWRAGLKCIAVYRDGCKLSQPISTSVTRTGKSERGLAWGERKRLPDTRNGKNHKFSIQGQDGYIITGSYPDGALAEVFVSLSKCGSTMNGLLDSLAISISGGLQHGVPLKWYVDKYTDVKFEPAGFTTNEDIRIAKSIIDYLARWLWSEYGDEKAPAEEKKTLDEQLIAKGLDGPPCRQCGNLTRRSGSCYCCTQCGTTTGCS